MWRAAVFSTVFLASAALTSAAIGEAVVLVSKDGLVSFEGELIALDKNFYVVRTSVGEVRIPISDVSCEGEGCPVAAPAANGVDPSKPEPANDRQIKLFKDFIEWRRSLAD